MENSEVAPAMLWFFSVHASESLSLAFLLQPVPAWGHTQASQSATARQLQESLVLRFADRLFAGKTTVSKATLIYEKLVSIHRNPCVDDFPIAIPNLDEAVDYGCGGFYNQSDMDLNMLILQLHVLAAHEKEQSLPVETRRVCKHVVENIPENLLSTRLRSLFSLQANSSRSGLSKKSWEMIVNIASKMTSTDTVAAELAALVRKLGVLPDAYLDSDSAFNTVAEAYESGHIESLRDGMTLALEYSDVPEASEVRKHAKDRLTALWKYFGEFADGDALEPFTMFFDGADVPNSDEALNDARWLEGCLGFLHVLSVLGFGQTPPAPYTHVETCKKRLSLVLEAFETAVNAEAAPEQLIEAWRKHIETEASEKEWNLVESEHADACSKMMNKLHAKSLKEPFSSFVRSALRTPQSKMFYTGIDEIEFLLTEWGQVAIRRHRAREALLAAAGRLKSGMALGVLEGASLLKTVHGCMDVADAVVFADVQEPYKIVKASFDTAYSEFMKTCKFETAARLHEKYRGIVAAIDSWDFQDCTYMTREAEREATEQDVIAMQIISTNLQPTVNTLEQLIDIIKFDKQKHEEVQAKIRCFKPLEKNIKEVPKLLALMMIADVLLKPHSPTQQDDIRNTLKYVNVKLHIVKKDLPAKLQARMNSPTDAGAGTPATSVAVASTGAALPGGRRAITRRTPVATAAS